jgi:hypothetical protein
MPICTKTTTGDFSRNDLSWVIAGPVRCFVLLRILYLTHGIFRWEKEELCGLHEVKAIDADSDVDSCVLGGDVGRYQFRSIQRPDVDLTSPPTRAENPVIMDSRFHDFGSPSPTYAQRHPHLTHGIDAYRLLRPKKLKRNPA